MADRSGARLPSLPIEALTLDNGLRVRLVPLPHLQSATASFFVRVGSRYERRDTNGLSHFLEHMVYRGTEPHPAAHELNLAIERLGGTLEAATHVDFTSYDLALPSETIVDGVGMLAEVLQQPLLQELGTEKQIIREEILEDLNEDGEQIDIDNVSRRLLFADHPLGFPITGPLANLERFESDDLRTHHQRYYTGVNSVLCIAGAFELNEIREAVHRHFDELPRGWAVEPLPRPKELPRDRFKFVHDHGSQTEMRVSFHTPGVASRESPALLLLSRIVDDGLSTRVHRMICEERGLAYEAFAGVDSLEECGVFDFGASVEHNKAPLLVEGVLELVQGLARTPPSDEELDKAKRRHLWDLQTVRDDPDEASSFAGTTALFALPEGLETLANEVAEVTPKQVQHFAQEYFDPSRAYLTCVGVLDQRQLETLRATFDV